MRDGDLLGRLIDILAVAQLRPELELWAHRPVRHRWRETNGRREIDLVIEVADGGIVALEIKATAAPTAPDADTSHGCATRWTSGSLPTPCCTPARGSFA